MPVVGGLEVFLAYNNQSCRQQNEEQNAPGFVSLFSYISGTEGDHAICHPNWDGKSKAFHKITRTGVNWDSLRQAKTGGQLTTRGEGNEVNCDIPMYGHTRILFSQKVERNCDMFYTTNEPEKRYVKGKKPATKDPKL